VYVVFKGFQPGIFTTWKQCHSQINGFKGACYKAYNTFGEAKQAFANSMESSGLVKEGSLMIEQSKQDFSDIKDFYNPGILRDIYNELNGVWKSQTILVFSTHFIPWAW
jgi:viroplasmin and RNaseH domain-containing protein